MSEPSQPVINFTSERLAYGPFSPQYLPLSLKWANDFAVSAPRGMVLRPYTHLNFHNIWLRVSSSNLRGQRAYTRAGFREAGRLREAQWIRGQAYDIIYMECLATEFDL